MKPITDPELLKRLEAPEPIDAPAPAPTAPQLQPVSDPELLARLENRPLDERAVGHTRAALEGVNTGIAQTAGLPMDLYNLVGNTLLNAGPAKLAELASMPEFAEWIRRNGYQPIYTGSSESVIDVGKAAGVMGYQPQTPSEGLTKDLAAGTAMATTLGAPGAARTLATEGITAGAKAFGKVGASGASSVAGGKGALAVNEAAREHGLPNLPDWEAELFGSVVGGVVGPGTVNRALAEKPQVLDDFRAAGVTPRSSADINPNTPVPFATRFGAQGTVRAAAQETQDELSAYAKRVLAEGDTPSLQQQGAVIRQAVDGAIDKLATQVDSAYGELNRLIPRTTAVQTTGTREAIFGIIDQAQDPAVKAALRNPAFERFSKVFDGGRAQTLSWGDLDLMRKEVGMSMRGATGAELGLYKKLYKGISSDMEQAAQGIDGGSGALKAATDAARTRASLLDDFLGTVEGRGEIPETLPGWLMQQSKQGGTRLDNVRGQVPASTWDEIGQWLLNNKGLDSTSAWQLDTFMKSWKTMSPEARASLVRDPALAEQIARVERLYDATAASRAVASSVPSGAGAFEGTLSGGGLLAGATGFSLGHPESLVAVGVGAVPPLASKIGAEVATAPWFVRSFGGPASDTITRGQQRTGMAGAALSAPSIREPLFPDTYTPEPQFEAPAPNKVMSWIGGADRKQVIPFVQQRLGPQVAQQLSEAGDNYDAALFALMANPQYRRKLVSSQ